MAFPVVAEWAGGVGRGGRGGGLAVARWWSGFLTAGVAVLLAVGCGFGSGSHDITGKVTVARGKHEPVGASATPGATPRSAQSTACAGAGVFARFRGGVPVVVRDGDSGEELAATTLGPGLETAAGACELRFTLEDVPEADLYRIAIGDEQGRGTPLSKQQLEEDDWQVFLLVGS